MMFLAEIVPGAKPFWEYGAMTPEAASAGLFFLILLCIGLAVDIGLIIQIGRAHV